MEKVMQWINWLVIYWILLVCWVGGCFIGLGTFGFLPATYAMLETVRYSSEEAYLHSYWSLFKKFNQKYFQFIKVHWLICLVVGGFFTLLLGEIQFLPQLIPDGKFLLGPIILVGLYGLITVLLTAAKLSDLKIESKVNYFYALLPLIFWRTSIGTILLLFSSIVFSNILKISIIYLLPVTIILGNTLYQREASEVNQYEVQ